MSDYRALLEQVAEHSDETVLPDAAAIRANGDRRTRRTRGFLLGAAAAVVGVAIVGVGIAAGPDTEPSPTKNPSLHPTIGTDALPWPGFARPQAAPQPPEGVRPRRALPDGTDVSSVATANGRYVAVGRGGIRQGPHVWTSADGVHWTRTGPWPARYGPAGPIAGTDQGFVMVVTPSAESTRAYLKAPYVLRSSDGLSWSAEPLPVPEDHLGDSPAYLLQSGHALVLVGGHGESPGEYIWVSRDDGETWSFQAADYFDPTPGGDQVCAVDEVGGQLVLAVAHPDLAYGPADGYQDTTWRSTDGSHWTRVASVKGNQSRSGQFCYGYTTQARWASGPDALAHVTSRQGLVSWPTTSSK